MERCLKLAQQHCGAPSVRGYGGCVSCPCSGAVLVDPSADVVLAVADPVTTPRAANAYAAASGHPLGHAAMRLIAELATQGAPIRVCVYCCCCAPRLTLGHGVLLCSADTRGLGRRVTPMDNALHESTTGAGDAVTAADVTADPAAKRQRQSNTDKDSNNEDVTSRGEGGLRVPMLPVAATVPYIGVGLEVYCAVEPCLMCAMALVHSRISRVVYGIPLQVGAQCTGAICGIHGSALLTDG